MKSKAGDSQNGEGDHQCGMLPELITAHTHNLLAMIEHPDTFPQIYKPVGNHRTDNYEDRDDIDSAECLAGFI